METCNSEKYSLFYFPWFSCDSFVSDVNEIQETQREIKKYNKKLEISKL